MLLAGGYEVFLNGGWSVMWFFLDYGMIGFFILAFAFWKLVFKSKYVRPGTADLKLGGLVDEIDQYEACLCHESAAESWRRLSARCSSRAEVIN